MNVVVTAPSRPSEPHVLSLAGELDVVSVPQVLDRLPDLVVATPGWFGFRGTGVTRGEHVHGLIGPEADRVYPDKSLPRPLQVLAHTPYSCRGVTTTSQTTAWPGTARMPGRTDTE